MSTTTVPSIHLPPSILNPLIEVFWNMGVAKYIATAGIVAMLYDIILTLEDEFEVIWKKKWGLTSVLYLVNRYLPIPALLMFTYHIAEFRGPVTDNLFVCFYLSLPLYSLTYRPHHGHEIPTRSCRAEVLLNLILWAICLAISSWLLFLRVISLWNQTKFIVYSVYILFGLCHLVTWTLSGITIGQMYPSIAYFAPVKVCGADSISMGMMPKIYWVIIALECYVFALQIVHHYKHAQFRRQHNLPSFTLVRTLYNDGYVYYICAISLRLFTCLLWEVAPGSLWYAGGQLEFTMTVALASRFHLHLRLAASAPLNTDLSYNPTDHNHHNHARVARNARYVKGEEGQRQSLSYISSSTPGMGLASGFEMEEKSGKEQVETTRTRKMIGYPNGRMTPTSTPMGMRLQLPVTVSVTQTTVRDEDADADAEKERREAMWDVVERGYEKDPPRQHLHLQEGQGKKGTGSPLVSKRSMHVSWLSLSSMKEGGDDLSGAEDKQQHQRIRGRRKDSIGKEKEKETQGIDIGWDYESSYGKRSKTVSPLSYPLQQQRKQAQPKVPGSVPFPPSMDTVIPIPIPPAKIKAKGSTDTTTTTTTVRSRMGSTDETQLPYSFLSSTPSSSSSSSLAAEAAAVKREWRTSSFGRESKEDVERGKYYYGTGIGGDGDGDDGTHGREMKVSCVPSLGGTRDERKQRPKTLI
ncbi:hypothetical protein FRC16_010533 [Serendipita sp. 398]|nr:hypothetical protein FRC16_010533 [Serendipita sp. 398]